MNVRRTAGFTLIEMMIVVAVIGILAAVAYPNYTEYLIKSRRADCKAVILSAANMLERGFSINSTYPSAADPDDPSSVNPVAAFTCPLNGGTQTYTLGYVTDGASFTLTATPTAVQTRDSCGTLTLTNTGARRASGTGSCW